MYIFVFVIIIFWVNYYLIVNNKDVIHKSRLGYLC